MVVEIIFLFAMGTLLLALVDKDYLIIALRLYTGLTITPLWCRRLLSIVQFVLASAMVAVIMCTHGIMHPGGGFSEWGRYFRGHWHVYSHGVDRLERVSLANGSR